LLCIGIGAWIANRRTDIARGAAISGSGGVWRLSRQRARMASALVGNRFWVLGGLDASRGARPDAETFDLTRTPRQTTRGLLSPAPLLARYDHTAQASGTDIYLIGGLSALGQVVGTLEKLDTRSAVVTTLAPMPTPRRMAHSAIYGGKIYVVGGTNTLRQRVGTLEIYDIATDTWKTGRAMHIARECDVALWKGQLIVAGGYSASPQNGGVLRDVEIYDIAADRWRRAPALPRPISAHHAVVSGDWVFFFGDYLTLSRVLALNARTGQSREIEAPGFTPRRHVVATSYRGRAYVMGGSTDDTLPPLDDVQIFDLQKMRQMAQSAP